jgi:hypothetical protein
LFVPDELVASDLIADLGRGLSIVQLDAETERLMYMVEAIRRVGGLRWSDKHFAIRCDYTLPAAEQQHEARREKVNREIDRVVQTLRIFKAGRFYLGGIIHRGATSQATFQRYARSWPENVLAIYMLENRSEIEEVVQLWTAIDNRKVRERPNLQFAIRWFADAGDSEIVEDRVIKLMTAAEALTGAGTETRKSDWIVDVISRLHPSSSDELKNRIRDAYRLRNEILHTGHLGQWRLLNGSKMTPAQIGDFVTAVEGDIRIALRTEILIRAGKTSPTG